jgi:hypothetical protein
MFDLFIICLIYEMNMAEIYPILLLSFLRIYRADRGHLVHAHKNNYARDYFIDVRFLINHLSFFMEIMIDDAHLIFKLLWNLYYGDQLHPLDP